MSTSGGSERGQDLELDLAGLLRALRASMVWLLPLVALVTGLTFMGLQFVSPKYLGEAKVLIESSDGTYPGAQRGVEESRALLDSEGIASQVQVLLSADLARRVAKQLDLASAFDIDETPSSSLTNDVLSLIGLRRNSAQASVEERVLKKYYKNLDVYLLEGSRVIAIEYLAKDPELAAAVANTIADEYVALQARAKRETTEFAATTLEPQIERLRKQVQDARKSVEDFRARADLLMGTENLTLNQRQLSEISSEQSAAQALEADAQAKAELIRELLRSGGSFEVASDVLNSQLIQRLREQQVALQSRIAELSITLLSNHPQLKALKSQQADYDRLIRAEARKILIGLENDAKVAKQRSNALKARLNELKVAAARTNSDQVRLRELEREANAKAAQLDAMIASYRAADTRLTARSLPADARIISRASVPIEHESPKIGFITTIAALVTFILGCTIVIMREFLSGRVLAPAASARAEPVLEAEEVPLRAPRPMPSAFSSTYGMPHTVAYGGPVQSPPPARAEVFVDESYEEEEEEELPPVREPRRPRKSSAPGRKPRLRKREQPAEMVPEPAELPDGRVVVLSLESGELSHRHAFDLVREKSLSGKAALMMEVFPGLEDPSAAAGFSDVVLGDAAFSNVIYRDAESRAHIIENGKSALEFTAGAHARIALVLETIDEIYRDVVIDLGSEGRTSIGELILDSADHVIAVCSERTSDRQVKKALKRLAAATPAPVDIRRLEAVSGRKGARRGAAA